MNKCLVCVDVYQVQAGDTLYSIGRRYNVSVGLLMKANMIDNPYDLRIGLKLCIPGFENELPEMPEGGNMPEHGQKPPHNNRPQRPEVPNRPMPPENVPDMPSSPEEPMQPGGETPEAPLVCRGTLHTVESGDTLYMIAKKHRINLNALIDANPGVDPYNLRIGMKLCIPR